MSNYNNRSDAAHEAIRRTTSTFTMPKNGKGLYAKISDYYGENVFDFRVSKSIPESVRREMIEISQSGRPLTEEYAAIVATAVTEWAVNRGVTHFSHWFQPLTGGSAEKHDAFLAFTENEKPIEKLSANQLIQGESDASSFPHGGARTTFEARGYTVWDLTSPMFIKERGNAKILLIPTAFISYYGEALDVKTPLLRSLTRLNQEATRFLRLIGDDKTQSVTANCGAEQEYFLIDKAFYYARPDLVMTGRTLFGSLTAKNQQLSDHYFGTVTERICSFMQELDYELHRLGIPAKTRHNEVAPGQYEIAPIYREGNLAADHNQLVMALIRKIAKRHDMIAILHEKPFKGINGSGKHLNWSMSDSTGNNLLEPGHQPQENHRFLAMLSIVLEALNRHAEVLRSTIATHGNDHRLGAHEAPPSIISAYLGESLTSVYDAILSGANFTPTSKQRLDLGADQLAHLMRDNTDRNRTSPFAFTGNKFEFRAVGSSQAVGFPLSILNAAVTDVIIDSYEIIEKELKNGVRIEDALVNLIRRWYGNSKRIVFNGDGYSQEWVEEAARRGLPNNRTTPKALQILRDEQATHFLVKTGVLRPQEIKTRHNVLVERYNRCREIEISTFIMMVRQFVLPAALNYKLTLAKVIKQQKDIGVDSFTEKDLIKGLTTTMDFLYDQTNNLQTLLKDIETDEEKRSIEIAEKLIPISENIAKLCNELEEIIPDELWTLPKYYDMLFLN